MRLFGKVDSEIDRYDRAEWMTPPFDLAFRVVVVWQASADTYIRRSSAADTSLRRTGEASSTLRRTSESDDRLRRF